MPNASYCNIKSLAFFLFVIVLSSALWPGCGKKGPPRAPRQPLPPIVNDLSYRIDRDRILLSWTIPSADGRSASYPANVKLFRSKQSVEDSTCEKCPIHFTEIADLPVQVKGLEKSGSSAMRFEEIIERGYRYIYKIVVYNKDGVGGKDSNTVEFSF
jgi:hypothetical protein